MPKQYAVRRAADGGNVAEIVLGQLLVLDLGELDARPLGDDAVGELPRGRFQREKPDAPPAARHVPGKLHRERRLADAAVRAEHDEVPRLGGENLVQLSDAPAEIIRRRFVLHAPEEVRERLADLLRLDARTVEHQRLRGGEDPPRVGGVRRLGKLRADVLHRPRAALARSTLAYARQLAAVGVSRKNLAHRCFIARRRLRHQQHRIHRPPGEEESAQRRIDVRSSGTLKSSSRTACTSSPVIFGSSSAAPMSARCAS